MSTGTKELIPTVEYCLKNIPRTRDDDFALYYSTISRILGAQIVSTIPFRDIMLNAGKYGIPPFESVTRARRKIQSVNENYRGNRYNDRKLREREFRREFSK